MRFALLSLIAGASVGIGGCATSDDLGPASHVAMGVRLPAAAVTISSLQLKVYDAAADCMGPDVSGGLELSSTSIELGVPTEIKISAGLRTLSVLAFDGGAQVARGCTRLELIPGETHPVTINLVETAGSPDAGVPDAMPADASPTPDAGVADAAVPDAAVPDAMMDATVPDAVPPPDAEEPPDAAPPPDAPDPSSCAAHNVTLLPAGTLNNESIGPMAGDDQMGTCGGTSAERVYEFTFFGDRQVDIDTVGNFAHRLYLRSTDCATGVESACVASSGNTANIHFDSLPGGTYYVFVDADDAAQPRQFDITLTLSNAVTPPPNDTCPAAEALVAGLSSSGTLDAANDDTATCVGGSEGEVFYAFSLSAEASVVVNLTSAENTSLSVRSSDCTTVLACVNDTAVGEMIDLPVLSAGTYYVVVEGVGGAEGAFNVGYTTGAPRPVNDECAGVTALEDGVARTGETLVNARDNADGSCGDTTSGDVVYEVVVPPGPNRRVRATVSNAGFDPVLYLRNSACDGTETGCAQTATGDTEVLDLATVAPGTYYLWVDAFGGGSGTFDVVVDLLDEVLPPTNDTCAMPDTLVEDTPETHSTFGATDDYDLTCLASDGPDAVHELTLAADASLLVSVTPTAPGWNAAISLRSDCAAGPDMSCVADQFPTRFINKPQLAAGTYSIIVDGDSGVAGEYSIEYDVRAPDGTFGYWTTDSTNGTYASIANTAGATNLNVTQGTTTNGLGDEFTQSISLPFTFSFYGNDFTTVNASDNGFITFDAPPSGTESFTPDCDLNSSAPSNAIYVFWDDGISWQAAGSEMWTRVDGVAPNRTFTIEYKNFNVLHCPSQCTVIPILSNQQIVLFENGDVELRYGPRTDPNTTGQGCTPRHEGCAATIGIDGDPASGYDSDQIQCSSGLVVDGRVIRYIYPR